MLQFRQGEAIFDMRTPPAAHRLARLWGEGHGNGQNAGEIGRVAGAEQPPSLGPDWPLNDRARRGADV